MQEDRLRNRDRQHVVRRRDDIPVRQFVRFDDLCRAGIVRNWIGIRRLIQREGFPPGVRLSVNTRAWPLDEVEAWLATRPVADIAVTD